MLCEWLSLESYAEEYPVTPPTCRKRCTRQQASIERGVSRGIQPDPILIEISERQPLFSREGMYWKRNVVDTKKSTDHP